MPTAREPAVDSARLTCREKSTIFGGFFLWQFWWVQERFVGPRRPAGALVAAVGKLWSRKSVPKTRPPQQTIKFGCCFCGYLGGSMSVFRTRLVHLLLTLASLLAQKIK